MIDHQNHNRSNYSHQKAVEIYSRYSRLSKGIEQPSADHSADDPKEDVADKALAGLVDPTLLPMNPASNPKTIHAKNDISLRPP